jgi:amidohydrolase
MAAPHIEAWFMDWREHIDQAVDSMAERLVATRRHLHAHPEPSGEEFETTSYLAELTRDAGFRTSIPATGRGLVAERPADDGLTRVALRADIDALRLHDEKDVPYRSRASGVTHACGHDGHVTCVLGAVSTLDAVRDHLPWAVPWRAIFQPAEESSEGGREMVEAGAVENVRSIVALHVDPERNTGHIGFRVGTLTAFCCEIDVVVRGRGGHAARPHHSLDPIASACHFASAVYQFVPRSIDSRDPTVVTFGSIHGGFTQNVIPEEVRMRGTLRSHSRSAIVRVEERLVEIARGVAAATGTRIDVSFKRGPDAVVNDPTVTETCRRAAHELLGAAALDVIETPSMGGEDFSEYLARVPGCLLRLGVGRPDAHNHYLHSPRFDLDEAALLVGAKLLARSAVHLSAPSS